MPLAPAFTAICMSKLVSPTTTLDSGCDPASATACSTIDGCGLEGWRSAVCSDTKRAWIPWLSRQCLRPRPDLPVECGQERPVDGHPAVDERAVAVEDREAVHRRFALPCEPRARRSPRRSRRRALAAAATLRCFASGEAGGLCSSGSESPASGS